MTDWVYTVATSPGLMFVSLTLAWLVYAHDRRLVVSRRELADLEAAHRARYEMSRMDVIEAVEPRSVTCAYCGSSNRGPTLAGCASCGAPLAA